MKIITIIPNNRWQLTQSIIRAGSIPAPSAVQWKAEEHLPLWRCEGPEAVKVKSVLSGGSLACPYILLLFWIMGDAGKDRQMKVWRKWETQTESESRLGLACEISCK